MVYVTIALFVLGLIMLVKGSDEFVKAAATIAKKLGVSEFVIGLTLVALGTSIPEYASAIFSSLHKETGLIMGNIVGADIANIASITGIAAIFAVVRTNEKMLKRDGYIMLFATGLLYVLVFNGVISRIEGLVLLALYAGYILFLMEVDSREEGKYHLWEFLNYFFKMKYIATIRSRLISGVRVNGKQVRITSAREMKELFKEGLVKDFLVLMISGVAVVLGARFFVNGAIAFAEAFHVSKTIIGVSIFSMGTTLPELGVTVAAARKGFGNIALGNVIGSNTTNILLILGTASVISPLKVIPFTIFYSLPYLLAVSVILLIYMRSGWSIKRAEGFSLLFLYAFFIASLVFLKGMV